MKIKLNLKFRHSKQTQKTTVRLHLTSNSLLYTTSSMFVCESPVSPRLSVLRRTWLMITFTLASLLSVSLLVHLVQACRGSVAVHLPERRDYSYVPLNDINGAASRAGGGARKSGKGPFALDDSDSQDEIWTPSGRL